MAATMHSTTSTTAHVTKDYLPRARAVIDVQPIYLGRRAAASRPCGHSDLFHQSQCSLAADHSVGVDRRWAASAFSSAL